MDTLPGCIAVSEGFQLQQQNNWLRNKLQKEQICTACGSSWSFLLMCVHVTFDVWFVPRDQSCVNWSGLLTRLFYMSRLRSSLERDQGVSEQCQGQQQRQRLRLLRSWRLWKNNFFCFRKRVAGGHRQKQQLQQQHHNQRHLLNCISLLWSAISLFSPRPFRSVAKAYFVCFKVRNFEIPPLPFLDLFFIYCIS